MEPETLRHELDFDGTDSTFPFGAHVSVVEVDIETGKVQMLRHVAVDDCGRILNPMLVRGQQHGGIAQGAAQALYEHVQYDDDGNLITSNLMDYAIPSAAELCSFETSNTQTDSPRNPLGAKGIGESGTIGRHPAIQNAVVDAVSHLGITHIDMPCTSERVWAAIQVRWLELTAPEDRAARPGHEGVDGVPARTAGSHAPSTGTHRRGESDGFGE